MAFAATACHEYERTSEEIRCEPLSEEALYWGSKKLDGNSEPGTTMSSLGKALSTWGQPEAREWPYDPSAGENVPSSPHVPVSDSWLKATVAARTIDPMELCDIIAQSRIVLAVIEVTDELFRPVDGRVETPSKGSTRFGFHAVALVGYDLAEQVLIVRNSWGQSWGVCGYGYLPFEYLAAPGSETQTLTAA